MSAPAKPMKGTRSLCAEVQPVAAPFAPVLALSSEEMRLLSAYRKMDDDTQGAALAIAESWAVDFPCRIVPTLRLIVGGAQ